MQYILLLIIYNTKYYCQQLNYFLKNKKYFLKNRHQLFKNFKFILTKFSNQELIHHLSLYFQYNYTPYC